MKKEYGVTGHAKDNSDRIDYGQQRWTLAKTPEGVPGLTMWVRRGSGLDQGGQRWGRWVKFGTWKSGQILNMIHGYQGLVVKRHFIQFDYAKYGVGGITGERLYVPKAKAIEFVEYWEGLHGRAPAQAAQEEPAADQSKYREALQEAFFKNLLLEAERAGQLNLYAYAAKNIEEIRLFTAQPDLTTDDCVAELEDFLLDQIASGTIAGSVDRTLHIFTCGPAAPSPYNPETVKSFDELAAATGGKSFSAPNAAALPGTLLRALGAGLAGVREGETIDLAIILDTTESMLDDIDAVKGELDVLLDRLAGIQATGNPLRVGLVLYRDIADEFTTRVYRFTPGLEIVRSTIQGVTVAGGGDEPEAVYDALHAAFTELDWQAQRRIGILIGDAPPHPVSPNGHTLASVTAEASKAGITVNLYPIIVGIA